MDDSWQETAFTSRHMHNRQSRNTSGKSGSGSGKSKRNAFDVRKTFGSYTVKCPAWYKLYTSGDDGVSTGQEAVLELYRLTECGTGVVGEMALPGVLRAAVLLAA
ncbi:hypothetical protein KCU73_g3588, partial [Aureobasidium melanogenum]